MSVSVELGLLLALLTAFGSAAGFLYKFKGAREAPAVDMRRPWHSSVALFRSPMYSLGIAIEVSRREWIGVGLTAAGLAFLAATLDGDGHGAQSRYDPTTLAIYIGAVGFAGLWLAAWSRRATILAVSAGLLWAASDTSIKALSSHLGSLGVGVAGHPLALVILVASLIGLLVSARSLQLGGAVPVIAITSAAANLTTIAAGPIVFGEPLPSGHLQLAVRMLAFAFVIVAAAMTPPPAPRPASPVPSSGLNP